MPLPQQKLMLPSPVLNGPGFGRMKSHDLHLLPPPPSPPLRVQILALGRSVCNLAGVLQTGDKEGQDLHGVGGGFMMNLPVCPICKQKGFVSTEGPGCTGCANDGYKYNWIKRKRGKFMTFSCEIPITHYDRVKEERGRANHG